MTAMDPGQPGQDEIDDAARAIRRLHHSPDGAIWPKCGQCSDTGCESLRWAIVQLDRLRERLDQEGRRDDPEFSWVDREDRELSTDLPTATIRHCGSDWPASVDAGPLAGDPALADPVAQERIRQAAARWGGR